MDPETICEDAVGAEGEVRLVKNKKDGLTYAAKIRFNPAIDMRTRNKKDKIVNAYKRFI